MKASIVKMFIIFNLALNDTYSQEIIPNTCDSTILTKLEYQKCKEDTAWSNDIIIKTNYIISFKTNILPKYRIIRKALIIPAALSNSIQMLQKAYDTILNKKLAVFQTEMDRNQKFVQPKAYISTLLSFQIFKFYPDVYALLLNDIHLQLIPKTKTSELQSFKKIFNKVIQSIPADLYGQLFKITNDINKEIAILKKQGDAILFQGSIQDQYRSQCNIVNFLLWEK